MVSIIIPVLNEEECIEGFLNHLQKFKGQAEIILVDGGSKDQTIEIASRFDDITIVSNGRGRALQMNAGAKVANGDILLFLHADTYLPENAINAVENIIRDGADGGCFSLKIDSSHLLLRIAARFITRRTKITHVATGDQTIFVRYQIFDELGGYADMPLMEDLDFTRRLKKIGTFVELDLKVSTSARRWEKWGVYKTILLMWLLRILYYIGVPPEKLVEFYRDVR
ncbi:TIGR04283 family arsenosugar biosynthesis glycosyltransferase [bacterium]|nr:TIGR04283 family arsenosugar biosynthesis glycosyltransferase [bacterium]